MKKKKLRFFSIIPLCLVFLLLVALAGCRVQREPEVETLSPGQEIDLPDTDPSQAEEPAGPADSAQDPTAESGTETTPETETFDFPYDPDRPCLMLTFDDGPSSDLTPRLVEELNARGVKATFFVLGKNAALNHDVIDLEFSSGHEVCSHGYDHQNKLTELSTGEINYQLDETAKVIREITGSDPTYLRPPYGAIDQATADKISVPMMLWTIDPRDWEVRDAEKVRDNILNDAYDGGVVICHDLYESTVQGVLDAVDVLLQDGWQFLTLSQYYQTIGMEPEPGQVYRGRSPADI